MSENQKQQESSADTSAEKETDLKKTEAGGDTEAEQATAAEVDADVADAEASPEEAVAVDPAAELLDQLQQAEEQMGQFKDMALRAEAEMQNVRRRAERDVEHAHKFALEGFVKSLLPVVDSLEKAVEAAEDQQDDPVIEGVRLCLKMFTDVLGKQNVEILDPVGEPFDPQVHEAMSMIENPEVESGSVVLVVQKGYRLNERLVRPAMVMVAK